MEREVKLISAWEGQAHETFFKLLKEETEKQLEDLDKFEAEPISEPLKDQIEDFTDLQKVLFDIFKKNKRL